MKQDVYSITSVDPRNQEWSGFSSTVVDKVSYHYFLSLCVCVIVYVCVVVFSGFSSVAASD